MNQEPSTDDPSWIHFYQLTADKPETSNIIQKIENKQDGWKTMVVIVSRGKKKNDSFGYLQPPKNSTKAHRPHSAIANQFLVERQIWMEELDSNTMEEHL